MPLDNGKVMIPWPLAERLLSFDLAAPTLRLTISMLHQLDLAGVCGPGSPRVCPVTWASCADLRERVGPKGSNSAREIRNAAAALSTSGLVDQIALLHNATKLQWQFSEVVWEAMRVRDTSNYVLIDLEELGQFRSQFQISVYMNATKRRRSKAPEFFVPYDSRVSEEANIRRLTKALMSVAKVLDWVCFTALELQESSPEPEHFKVRIIHSAARWRYHAYLLFKRPKAVWKVDRSGITKFDPKVVCDERADLVQADDMGLDHQVVDPV
ncbi:hypothetical protein OB2597_05150 [Pseudooceanicola batsensis HTCC2597]|uniref:Uncharacterized protein n=1 Tax=Pseudooceanicola batsensis (strain ATCC BAA-863 / DSM 15984 / KCTC 12145 / HTCC2597) TaxID=252305 RepID=A3TSL5_PSEBH|nr:hypothetical protein [Pseudooceanicola batsensis]EAQ04642.1 hypothetical protein OB2597_05150 [Pseudooceanicola batsensis HTCC2597]